MNPSPIPFIGPSNSDISTNATISQGQMRPRAIEEELANRILSDISEEGSVTSDHDDAERRLRRSSQERLFSDGFENLTDGERTPSFGDFDDDQVSSIKVRPPSSPKQMLPQADSAKHSAAASLDGRLHPPMRLQKSASADFAYLHKPILQNLKVKSSPGLQIEPLSISATRPLSISTKSQVSPTPGAKNVILSPRSPREVEISVAVRSRSPSTSGLLSPATSAASSEAGVGKRAMPSDGFLMSPTNFRNASDLLESVVAAEPYGDRDFDRLMEEVERIKQECAKRAETIGDLRKKLAGDGEFKPDDTDWNLRKPTFGYEPAHADWESQYQIGPETYLLQTRDANLAARIREYRRHLFGGDDSTDYIAKGFLHFIGQDVAVRERRRYRDIIKTDGDLLKTENGLSQQLNLPRFGTVSQSQSTGCVTAAKKTSVAINHDGTHAPVFQYRVKNREFMEGDTVTLECSVFSSPQASITWYRNDSPITESRYHHLAVKNTNATLTISPAYKTDSDFPQKTTRPEVELASDTEVFLTWQPSEKMCANEAIQGYRLEFRRVELDEFSAPWQQIPADIDEEAAVIRGLDPLGIYQFRVFAKNGFGFGDPSLATRLIQTHQKGVPKLNIDILRSKVRLSVTNAHHGSANTTGGSLGAITEEAEESDASTGAECNAKRNGGYLQNQVELNRNENPQSRYQIEYEIYRGRFCVIRNLSEKRSGTSQVAKIFASSTNNSTATAALREFEVLRQIQHENIVQLNGAYLREGSLMLVLEKLGEEILSRFVYNDYFTEANVTDVVRQLLHALEWLHFKRVVYLDLQPDNVMFTSTRSWHVKLIDFGSAQELNTEGNANPPQLSMNKTYIAPEVHEREPLTAQADIWALGLITFILLSGQHPYESEDSDDELTAKAIVNGKWNITATYANVTEDALKFLAASLKKSPSLRMSTYEGLNHVWLQLSNATQKRQETVKFSVNRLRRFAQNYEMKRLSSTSDGLLQTQLRPELDANRRH